jgi:MFS family permease
LGQAAAMNMQIVTGSLLIYRLTGSAALLGTLSLVTALPMIVFSLFGGAIADRIQKKQILVVCLICSAAISICVALSLDTGYLNRENTGSWWILMASAFFQGITMGLLMPARQAMIPEIVSREQMMNAVALNLLGFNVLGLLAPGAAGFMIDAFDFKSVYYTMAGLSVYAAVLIFFLPHTSKITARGSNILLDIKNGLKYIRHNATILLVLTLTLIGVVLSMPYQQLLPIFVDDILGVGSTGMGVLMSVSSAGAMAGSFILASLPNKKRGIMLVASGFVSGLALVIFAFSSSWALSLAFIVFIGLGQSIRGTTSGALLQSYTKADYMGRVMSIFMMQWGLMSLCTFFAGVLADVIPVQWVVGGLATALIILSTLTMIFIPRIRRLD